MLITTVVSDSVVIIIGVLIGFVRLHLLSFYKANSLNYNIY